MRRLVQVTLALALLALPAAALAASKPVTKVPNCNTAVYKPKRLILACGDGSEYLAKLKWSRWGARSAAGAGFDEVNNCTPDCVRGHFHAYPATVTLSRPRRCARVKGHKVFSRIVLLYPGAHPGSTRKVVAPMPCPF